MKKLSVICMGIIFINIFLKEFFSNFYSFYPQITMLSMGILIGTIYFYAKGLQRNISVVCFSVSIFLMIYNRFDCGILYKSLEKSVGMILIFLVLPLLTFSIEKGKYSEAMNEYIKKFDRKSNKIFVVLVIFHLILTIILNIPAMMIIQKIIEKNKFGKNYLTRLYTAGYSFYMVFSPYDGIVNLVLLMVGVRYYEYFIYALTMGAFIIIFSLVLLKITDKNGLEIMKEIGGNKKNCSEMLLENGKRKVFQLLKHISILLGITVLSSYIFKNANNMMIISLVILFYSIIWSFQICNFKEYISQFEGYSEKVTKFSTILVFLISTNCLGEILKYTQLSEYMEIGFSKIIFLPEYFIMEILIGITVLMSLLGVHMIIPVTSMAMIIKPEFLNISAPAFVLLLLVCWVSGMCVSPFVPFSAMVAETIDDRIINVTFKYNKWYMVMILLFSPAVILVLNNLLQ